MSNFKIGQKVVCVDPKNTVNKNLVYGEIYTIVGIRIETGGLSLKEAPATSIGNFSGYYDKNRFRPLDHAFADEVEAMIKEQLKEEFA